MFRKCSEIFQVNSSVGGVPLCNVVITVSGERRSNKTIPLLVILLLPCFQSVYIGPAPADWRTCFSRYLQCSAQGSAELSCHRQPRPRSLWRSSCRGAGRGPSRRRSSGGSSWWAGRGGPAGRPTSGSCAPPAGGADQCRLDQPGDC